MSNAALGLLIILGSGFVGACLDVRFKVKEPAIYWCLGILSGLVGGLLFPL